MRAASSPYCLGSATGQGRNRRTIRTDRRAPGRGSRRSCALALLSATARAGAHVQAPARQSRDCARRCRGARRPHAERRRLGRGPCTDGRLTRVWHSSCAANARWYAVPADCGCGAVMGASGCRANPDCWTLADKRWFHRLLLLFPCRNAMASATPTAACRARLPTIPGTAQRSGHQQTNTGECYESTHLAVSSGSWHDADFDTDTPIARAHEDTWPRGVMYCRIFSVINRGVRPPLIATPQPPRRCGRLDRLS